jgi:hypothetical protein
MRPNPSAKVTMAEHWSRGEQVVIYATVSHE